MRHQGGFSALEIIVAVAIVGLIALCSIPAFASYRRSASLTSQAAELRSIFRAVRSRAVASGRHAGVKFTRAADRWTYSLYEDGDGDGIRNDDIASGVDRRYAGPSVFVPQFNIARIALLDTTIRDPDGDRLPPTASAVQFNRSTICSFAPIGTGTPGTVYITDGVSQLCAIRVYGASGRVRMLRYNAARRRWDQR